MERGVARGVIQDYIRPVHMMGMHSLGLEVECGPHQGLLLLSRLCRGSSGRCVLFQGAWLTPNEFQLASGRESAKDWKRSIRHRGRSLKLLLSKGFLVCHAVGCECSSQDSNKLEGSKMAATAAWGSPPPLPASSPNPPSTNSETCERRREGRLTSIIEQLRSSRGPSSGGEGAGDAEPPTTELPPHNKNRKRQRMSAEVKSERLSPGGGEAPPTTSSPPQRATPQPPSSPGSAATPGHIKQMEHMMNRNYSDFMRSLAAKYNNSNPNDYFSTSRNTNGFLAGTTLDARFSFGKGGSGAATPFPGLSVSSSDTKATKSEMFSSPAGASSQPQALLAAAAAANLGHPLGFPLIDMSSTQALLSMVRSASAQTASQQLEHYLKGANSKRGAEGLGPLDLSPTVHPKRPKVFPKSEAALLDKSVSPKPPPRSGSASSASSSHSGRCLSLCTESKPCQQQGEAVAHWGVEDVCTFVAGIDLCAEYVQAFRDQAIDGSALPLLTEDHLTSPALGLKLGPALKLRAVLARRLGHCASCLHCVHCHGTPPAPSPNNQ